MRSLDDRTFHRFADLMQLSVGLSFGDNKKPLLSSRLATRIQKLGLDGYEEYFDLIATDQQNEEFQVAVNLLTTNETYFFREPDHYAALEQHLAGHKTQRPLAIWSAAASFGDEAYSIAMLMSELQQRGRIGGEWSILGTDISDRVLQAACTAIYPEDRLRNVSADLLKRYCLHGEGESEGLVQIHPRLRERVRFGWLNLCAPIEELGPFDAVFLRNVLIYFDTPTKIEVVDRVLTQLRPSGLLFLGTAEGRVSCNTPLKSIAPGVFRKIAT